MGVRRKVTQPRTANGLVTVGQVADAHVQHWPVPGSDRDATAIHMCCRSRDHRRGRPGYGDNPTAQPACASACATPCLLGTPSGRGYRKSYRCTWRRAPRYAPTVYLAVAQHETEHSLAVARAQHQRVYIRFCTFRHCPFERDWPLAIVDVIRMKMDCAKVCRCLHEVHGSSRARSSLSLPVLAHSLADHPVRLDRYHE